MTYMGRRSPAAKNWSVMVQERDLFRCQHCDLDDKSKLHAHHIVSWKDSQELRFEVDNGITLCKSCHQKEHVRLSSFCIGQWIKGRKITEEHRKNLSESHKGKPAWNKGLKGTQEPWNKGIPMTEFTRIKLKERLKGRNKGRSWKKCPDTGKRIWYDK